ncbi:unnamed protein product [Adineta ricciae]|uniref:Uncharacterized protein n=1 Tax=Adineta ricciae TaxID=249248 RepID=A0A814MN71_ADIRI|nr:unnamed protein product [Adineta ricciae]CAF1456050.1 unnamed protein product [Adineta ricciae]
MAESKLDIIITQDKGRCFVVNQHVSQGEIVFICQPYGIVPFVITKDFICANCICIPKERTSSNKMIECRQKCHHTFYCSDQCEQHDWDKFHKYECSFLDKIFEIGFTNYILTYTRQIMRMLTLRFYEIMNKSCVSKFEDVWKLCSNYEKFTMKTKDEYEAVAKILTEYVLTQLVPHLTSGDMDFTRMVYSFLPDRADVEKLSINVSNSWINTMTHTYSISSDACKQLLFKIYILICIEEINSFFLTTFLFDGWTQSCSKYAVAVYPQASFFNHSCSPNLGRFFIEKDGDTFRTGDIVFFAMRSLEKGEEACITYTNLEPELYIQELVDTSEIIKSQAKRNERLKEIFLFDCNCVRCINESKGILDSSFVTLVKEFKCSKTDCTGWLIPTVDDCKICEACGSSP